MDEKERSWKRRNGSKGGCGVEVDSGGRYRLGESGEKSEVSYPAGAMGLQRFEEQISSDEAHVPMPPQWKKA